MQCISVIIWLWKLSQWFPGSFKKLPKNSVWQRFELYCCFSQKGWRTNNRDGKNGFQWPVWMQYAPNHEKNDLL